jgi:hypothetical protein
VLGKKTNQSRNSCRAASWHTSLGQGFSSYCETETPVHIYGSDLQAETDQLPPKNPLAPYSESRQKLTLGSYKKADSAGSNWSFTNELSSSQDTQASHLGFAKPAGPPSPSFSPHPVLLLTLDLPKVSCLDLPKVSCLVPYLATVPTPEGTFGSPTLVESFPYREVVLVSFSLL